jgi:mRNA interferase MazF
MNKYLDTVIIAPMTTVIREYPSRAKCKFKGKTGQIILDQIRTVSKKRLKKKIGIINEDLQNDILNILREIFT